MMNILFEKKKYLYIAFLMMVADSEMKLFAQCLPEINLSNSSYKIMVDDFSKLSNNILINGVTFINVTATDAACVWDLYATTASFTSTLYSSQGVALTQADIDIKAVSGCETADQDYGAGICSDPARICNSFNTPFSDPDPHYIIGTAAPDGILLKSQAPFCNPPDPDDNINDPGNASTDPFSHRFRVDIQIPMTVVPVITPGNYILILNFILEEEGAGLMSSALFTLEIDIQPILQLKMNTSNQLNFSFDDIKKYNAGIVQYGATILNVSSNMNWDLFAVGTSTLNESTLGGSPFWDNSAVYSTGGSINIPLNALELQQFPANPFAGGACVDYSPAFTNPISGNNNIEVAFGGAIPTFVGPTICPFPGDRTIAGNWDGVVGFGNSMGPGTYTPDLIGVPDWNENNFRYVLTYRLTPGLPATFSNGIPAMPTYATPGYYTMQVRYVLSEDQ